MIQKSKKPNWHFMAKALIKIVDAIVPLLTIGFYWTDLEYKFTKWIMFK
jgi:hypothetical protein